MMALTDKVAKKLSVSALNKTERVLLFILSDSEKLQVIKALLGTVSETTF